VGFRQTFQAGLSGVEDYPPKSFEADRITRTPESLLLTLSRREPDDITLVDNPSKPRAIGLPDRADEEGFRDADAWDAEHHPCDRRESG